MIFETFHSYLHSFHFVVPLRIQLTEASLLGFANKLVIDAEMFRLINIDYQSIGVKKYSKAVRLECPIPGDINITFYYVYSSYPTPSFNGQS